MECSVSDGDANQSFRSPPRRRRSTFFERRDSFVPPVLTDNVDPISSTSTNHPTDNEQQKQDLLEYYKKLVLEKEQWKKEVNNRRNRYHDLRQQYQMFLKSSGRSRISYSALTNEDIEFIKAKPNISKLIEGQQKLQKSLKETRALYRRVNELDDVILRDTEEKVTEITSYIFENSTVELLQ